MPALPGRLKTQPAALSQRSAFTVESPFCRPGEPEIATCVPSSLIATPAPKLTIVWICRAPAWFGSEGSDCS